MTRDNNVLPFPVDAPGPRFVRPMGELVDPYAAFIETHRQTFAEKLVAFMRWNSFRLGIALYVLCVAVGAYIAFQLGRGVL